MKVLLLIKAAVRKLFGKLKLPDRQPGPPKYEGPIFDDPYINATWPPPPEDRDSKRDIFGSIRL